MAKFICRIIKLCAGRFKKCLWRQNHKYPDLIIRDGKGSFITEDIKFEATFELIFYPEKTIIKTQIEKVIDQFKALMIDNNWELRGVIDCKTKILVRNLHLERTSNSNLFFQPLKEILIGDSSNDCFNYGEFPLKGLYIREIGFNHNNWQISSIGSKEKIDLQKQKSKNWNIQLEGNTLTIKTIGTTTEDFHTIANSIALLLSLAIGNAVIFDRQLFFKDDKLILEIWRRKAGYNFGVEPCIPDTEINYYIQKSIGSFEKWSKEKQDTFYSVVNYINSSSQGFIEDRILGLCIAWESIASRWGKRKEAISNDLNPLKDLLKKSIDNFELPENHDKSFIKDRILSALEWGKLYNKLNCLSASVKLTELFRFTHGYSRTISQELPGVSLSIQD